MTLLDQFGRPIDLNALSEEKGAAVLAGIRTVWQPTVADTLSPQRLAHILRSADQAAGDARPYLTLAEEMEEREPHYYSVLSTRKLSVSGLEMGVKSASEDAADEQLADEIRDLLERPEFGDVVSELLDGLAKSYSVIEIMWDRTKARWEPQRYAWRDPRFFRFDWTTGQELRLLDDKDPVYGLPLDPYKWIQHRPKLKTGLPIRGGLARLAAGSYICKSYTVKDVMAFLEVFGMPMRLGRYSPKATDDEIRKLINAVSNLGTDAAAVIPDSMKIDFMAAAGGSGGEKLFLGVAEWLDKQVSKAILGQTMTTDEGSSHSQSKTHEKVKQSIRDADVKQLERTLNRDLVRAYIDLNHGPQAKYPRIHFLIEEEEDLAKFSAAIVPLIDRGLPVSANGVLDKLGLSKPEQGEAVLSPASKAVAAKDPEPLPELNRRHRSREEPPAYRDDIDDLRDEAIDEWQPLIDPVLLRIGALAKRATSLEEFKAALPELLGDDATNNLVNSLSIALFQSRVLGAVES
jgi:phage gp29-like protein